MRLVAIFVALAFLLLLPFFIWGERFESRLAGAGAQEWISGYGDWAWAAGLVLLVGDLLLPVPSTAVHSALGWVYGLALGGAIGAAGSILSGLVAYTLCRALGRGAAVKLAGERDLARGEELFSAAGGWIVALSRWLPLLPEVVACMAGLARMPLLPFVLALACGSVPMAFAFAAIGALGVGHPALALTLSAGVPLLLWPLARALLRKRRRAPVSDR